jgi:hypothetical protein
VRNLADIVLNLQQADGLCWAKADYRVKYLEDNSEVFAGLSDLAKLESEVFDDAPRAASYRLAAGRIQRGILDQLYDPKAGLFLVAKFENGQRPPANLDKWYPDTQAQLWPLLFGVVAADDAATRAVIPAVNRHWNGLVKPDWASQPELVNEGSLESGDAHAMLLAGETQRVQVFAQAARRVKFTSPSAFAPPFNVEDAGWLLQILTRLPKDR